MKKDQITFSVETSCGEDVPSIHLYFGDNVRIKIADSTKGMESFIEHCETMLAEIRETHPSL